MKYKNYIWDFDGTIFDSYPHTLQCLWMVLEEEGLTGKFDRETVAAYLQVSYNAMREYTGISNEAFRRMLEYAHRFGEDELQPIIDIYPDTEKVLREIVDAGGKNFIYTHRDKLTIKYLEKFGVLKYFTDIVTAEERFPLKPAPNAILAIIERNGLIPSECIMIGDREIDGQSGKNAGIDGALVNYPPILPDGSSPAEESKMDYIADSLTKFMEMVR